jgi:hypothetical protein
MNQPAALSAVLKLREKIAGCEDEIAELLRETQSTDKTDLRVSLALWLLIIVAVGLIVSALV